MTDLTCKGHLKQHIEVCLYTEHPDRTRGLVDLDVKIGFDKIFSAEEEEKLVGHVSNMAEIGYGYGVSGIRYMAKNYAESLGKPVKAKDALSNCWFYSFL